MLTLALRASVMLLLSTYALASPAPPSKALTATEISRRVLDLTDRYDYTFTAIPLSDPIFQIPTDSYTEIFQAVRNNIELYRKNVLVPTDWGFSIETVPRVTGIRFDVTVVVPRRFRWANLLDALNHMESNVETEQPAIGRANIDKLGFGFSMQVEDYWTSELIAVLHFSRERTTFSVNTDGKKGSVQ